MNRREDEFDSKLDWDNLLEQRETMIMNPVTGVDVTKTEATLRKYKTSNLDSIRANQAQESQEASAFLEQQSFEQEQARLRRHIAREEYEREHNKRQTNRECFLSRLAASTADDAANISREEDRKILLKKSSTHRSEEDRLQQKQASLHREVGKSALDKKALFSGAIDSVVLIKGLKRVSIPEPEKPYNPFGDGLDLRRKDYYVLKDHYPSQWLEEARTNTTMPAGGFDIKKYYSRTLLEPFAGLGCFTDDEVAKRDARLEPFGVKKVIAT